MDMPAGVLGRSTTVRLPLLLDGLSFEASWPEVAVFPCPVVELLALPRDLLVEVVHWLLQVARASDISHLICSSQIFNTGGIVVAALELRAKRQGRELLMQPPSGELNRDQWLLWEEQLMLCHIPPVLCDARYHSAFLDPNQVLWTRIHCNHNMAPTLLGHQGDVVDSSQYHPVFFGTADMVVSAIALGDRHTLVLNNRKAAYSFGHGRHGQLGNGNENDQASPQPVQGLSHLSIVSVAAGKYHSLALTDEGQVYSFGANFMGQLGLGFQSPFWPLPTLVDAFEHVIIKAIAASANRSLALDSSGRMYTWGQCYSGALGHAFEQPFSSPVLLLPLAAIAVSIVSAGDSHTLVASREGALYSFGNGSGGQLGHSNLVSLRTPQLVASLHGVRVSSVAAGAEHSLVLGNGQAYTFGRGLHGCLGLGHTGCTHTPQLVPGLIHVLACSVVAGRYSSYVISTDGEVYAWGHTCQVVDLATLHGPAGQRTPPDESVFSTAGRLPLVGDTLSPVLHRLISVSLGAAVSPGAG
jgi:alpha-tubulin suppressor-like RCC1 family protein